MGLREYVSLAVLLLVAGLAFYFFRNGDDTRERAARLLIDGPPFDTPHNPIHGEGEWSVRYFADGASETFDAGGTTLRTLDVDVAGAPIAEVADDHWKLVASMDFSGEIGSYRFRVTYRGSASIMLNDRVVAASQSPGTGELTARVAVRESPSKIRVEVRDTGGPTSAHWSMVRIPGR